MNHLIHIASKPRDAYPWCLMKPLHNAAPGCLRRCVPCRGRISYHIVTDKTLLNGSFARWKLNKYRLPRGTTGSHVPLIVWIYLGQNLHQLIVITERKYLLNLKMNYWKINTTFNFNDLHFTESMVYYWQNKTRNFPMNVSLTNVLILYFRIVLKNILTTYRIELGNNKTSTESKMT